MGIDCPDATRSASADDVERALGEAFPQEQHLRLGKTQSQTPVQPPATLGNASSRSGNHGCRQINPYSLLELPRSNEDGHRFTASTNDDKESRKPAEEADERSKFEVKWDGELDPENPRTMSQARKWLIVMIASTSSTCVCEELSHSRRGGFCLTGA